MKIPLSLSVYEHAARFVNNTPWEVSRDEELLYKAHREAYKLYQHFPVVVGIDIYNLEAEAYGGVIRKPAGIGIPAITSAVFSSLDEALEIKPFDPAHAGRIPMMIAAAQRLKTDFRQADVRLPISGPFSIAASLLGLNQLMMDIATQPDKTRRFLEKLIPGQISFSQAVLDAGLDVAFFESAAAPPLLSPTQFREIELPPLKHIIQEVAQVAGHAVPCIIGGDTAPLIPAMVETGTDFLICPAETDRYLFVEKMDRYPDVKVRVNLDPQVYTYRTKQKIVAEIDEVLKLAESRPNLLLGTGAIPYETPPENILFIKEYVA